MKPILLTVDDDPHVLIAFEHDLKRAVRQSLSDTSVEFWSEGFGFG